MDPSVDELYEAGPPPTQLLDDAVPIMSSCLNLSFIISSHYSALITAYFARWGMGVFLADNRGEFNGWMMCLVAFLALNRHSRLQMNVHLINIQDWLKTITNTKCQKRKINYLASCPCYNMLIDAFC